MCLCDDCSYILVLHWTIFKLSKINFLCDVFPYTSSLQFLIIIGWGLHSNNSVLSSVNHCVKFSLSLNLIIAFLDCFLFCMGSKILTLRVNIIAFFSFPNQNLFFLTFWISWLYYYFQIHVMQTWKTKP
jgi:hypothetical protein